MAAQSSAEADAVVADSASSPVTMVELVAASTSTLLATGTTAAETITTQAPTTSTTVETALAETTTTAAPSTTAAPTTTETTTAPAGAQASSPAPTTAPPTTAPPTTAPPTTAPPTTAAPTTAPPTTAAPASTSGSDYSDPNTLQVWLDLAQCESGGNWSINTGNGYYGGLQFSLGAWEAVGGTGYPHEHSRDTQIEMGRRLQAQSGWGQWPHCSRELGLR